MTDEQSENLDRVSTSIGRSVVTFCERVYGTPLKQFYAEELRRVVARDTGILAPASADRVLRDLRQRGEIGYRVLSRRESLCEVTGIGNGKKGVENVENCGATGSTGSRHAHEDAPPGA